MTILLVTLSATQFITEHNLGSINAITMDLGWHCTTELYEEI